LPPARKKKAACSLCGTVGLTHLFDKDGYPVARCPECTLIQVDAELSRAELNQIYGAEYFTEEEVLYDYVSERPARLESGARAADALARLVPGGRLLDIGCAAGFFLKPAARHYDVTGVELSQFASAYARSEFGLRVLTGDVADVNLDGEQFDVVTMWATIEHVSDPLRTVKAAAALTRPEGLFVLSTGDATGPLGRRNLHGWNLMTPPHHLFFFSPRTIDRILAQAGFRLRRIVYDGIVAAGGPLRSPKGQRAAMMLGTGNVMTVYAIRTESPPRRSSRMRRAVARYRPLALAVGSRS
jgi:2-polyprenyl-3-methyl-5-hydroxy-6-metoxy-1,4-benzoquinol methylase